MLTIAVLSTAIIFIVAGYMIGKRHTMNVVRKQLDSHVKYLRNIIFDLIAFGHQNGYNFPVDKESEKKVGLTLTPLEILLLSLQDALEHENYERAAQLRDQIQQLENKKE